MALHWAWNENTGKGFEVYPHCFQANVKGSGSAVPTDTAQFPAIYSPANYPMYEFSVANGGKQTWSGESVDGYVPPGPAVYTGGAAPAPAPAPASSSAAPSSAPTSAIPTEGNSTPTVVDPVPSATDSEDIPVESDTVPTEDPAESTVTPVPASSR